MQSLRGVKLTGIEGVDRMLRSLPEAVSATVLHRAYSRAGKPLIEDEKGRIRSRKGNLARSIGAVRVKNFKEEATTRIGPRRGGGAYGKGYAAHLVEEGVRVHAVAVKGKKVLSGGGVVYGTRTRPFAVQPRPFAEPAIRQKLPEVRALIAAEISESVVRALRSRKV